MQLREAQKEKRRAEDAVKRKAAQEAVRAKEAAAEKAHEAKLAALAAPTTGALLGGAGAPAGSAPATGSAPCLSLPFHTIMCAGSHLTMCTQLP